VFKGKCFGAVKTAVGEIVFNTIMTGYQELLTDPTYKGQIINMTYPLIGNYGISNVDNESENIHAFGLVVKDICDEPSNSMCTKTLDQWMKEHDVPGVAGVDTRQITKKIRNNGTIKCLISTEGISISEAKKLCTEYELKGDWMKDTAVSEKTILGPTAKTVEDPLNIAVIDFGVKRHIIDYLRQKNCRLTLYPYGTEAEEIIADDPDGIFLTNGPGNPEEAVEAIEEVKTLIAESELPMFGIGLGHQVLTIALGGTTYKLKYGHRGGNHGVYDKETKRSYITSQNHGYAVNHDSIILKGMEVTHLNLNDGTVEGMEHRDLPIFSTQFHPEAKHGANDSGYLFDKFITMMKEETKNA
ncbi:MAG: glutamine-hydrolyzing carbamoyl-phosphate synthase small subunit, partial [Bacillota bacterium]|nr:glutamine-hydrolyzing carbamoyl-phosphate synthase small subunit [Bacillota bacterium]